MRYFLASLALLVLVVLSVAGFRGHRSSRPPLEIFADMKRQPKIRPQSPSDFFPDGRSSRPPVPGTVARQPALDVAGKAVYPYADNPVFTGRERGKTNYVAVNPYPITHALLARGRERFQINCEPCHGALGDGKGITTHYGMTIIANLHEPRIVRMPDGEIFHIITDGKNMMPAYGAQIPPADRWAIIAYVRALQLSQLGTLADVPTNHQADLQ